MTGSCSPARAAIYERRGSGPPEAAHAQGALSVDTRGSRFAFSGSRKWSHEPWLGSTRLTHVPGGGASPDFLDALNPTFSGNSIYWLLSRQGDHNFGEIHRYNRAEGATSVWTPGSTGSSRASRMTAGTRTTRRHRDPPRQRAAVRARAAHPMPL